MTRFSILASPAISQRKESDMSMQFHRNVVIPVSFAVFAIAMIVGPAVNAINVGLSRCCCSSWDSRCPR